MAWKYSSADGLVEIVVDSDFSGRLHELALSHPVWIVDTEANKAMIDDIWSIGSNANLFEVNRYPVADSNDRRGNLLAILGDLDEHYGRYRGVVVHGIPWNSEIDNILQREGFEVVAPLADGFSANMNPRARGLLIGRDYSDA